MISATEEHNSKLSDANNASQSMLMSGRIDSINDSEADYTDGFYSSEKLSDANDEQNDGEFFFQQQVNQQQQDVRNDDLTTGKVD